jgi:hypothetical protein
MAKFTLEAEYLVFARRNVEAADEDEALDMDLPDFSLCVYCSKQGDGVNVCEEPVKLRLLDENGEEVTEFKL